MPDYELLHQLLNPAGERKNEVPELTASERDILESEWQEFMRSGEPPAPGQAELISRILSEEPEPWPVEGEESDFDSEMDTDVEDRDAMGFLAKYFPETLEASADEQSAEAVQPAVQAADHGNAPALENVFDLVLGNNRADRAENDGDLAGASAPLAQQQHAARGRRAQRAYVRTYNRLVGSRLLSALKKPGGSFNMHGSTTVSVDAIAAALSSAAHGLPVPTSWLASVGPQFELSGNGSVSTGDTTKVKSSLSLGFTARISASVASNLGFSGGLSVGATLSLDAIYDSLEHFVAVCLGRIRYLIKSTVYRLYGLVESGYKFVNKAYGRLRDTNGNIQVDGGEIEDEDIPDDVEEEGDIQEYKDIRALEKQRRTKVKSLSLKGSVEASALTLLGAGIEAKITGNRFTRKRNISGDVMHKGHKWHEMKHGYVLEGSTHFTAGPLEVNVSLSSINMDANPDNDGVYLTATLSGGASILGQLMTAAPDMLSNITFAAGNTMDILKGVLSATVTKVGLPIAGASVGIEAGTDVTLVWYQAGKEKHLGKDVTVRVPEAKPAHLLYIRNTLNLGVNFGASGIPLPGGVMLDAGVGAGHTRNIKEKLGHHTIAYVQTVYLGMKSRQGYKPNDWDDWAVRHAEDMQQMMRSDNVLKELKGLADELGQEGADILHDELSQAHVQNDYGSWLIAVERLFDLEARRRRGTGDVSAGFTKYASPGDRGKQLTGWMKKKIKGDGAKFDEVRRALRKGDAHKLRTLRMDDKLRNALWDIAHHLDSFEPTDYMMHLAVAYAGPAFDDDNFERWQRTVERIFREPTINEVLNQ